jgi:hypothetical protein
MWRSARFPAMPVAAGIRPYWMATVGTYARNTPDYVDCDNIARKSRKWSGWGDSRW